jgi:hypothetical protein
MPDTQIHDTQRKAAELHDSAAHAHGVAEQHGKQAHLSGHEQTSRHWNMRTNCTGIQRRIRSGTASRRSVTQT